MRKNPNKLHIKAVCDYCGSAYIKTGRAQKYCSKTCSDRAYYIKKKLQDLNVKQWCAHCGKEFRADGQYFMKHGYGTYFDR